MGWKIIPCSETAHLLFAFTQNKPYMMFTSLQDILDQKAIYKQLLQRVEALESKLQHTHEPETSSTDDLTRIKGIGKVTAARLQKEGFVRFDQIAALSEDEIPQLEEKLGLFPGKIKREKWIEQARSLSKA